MSLRRNHSQRQLEELVTFSRNVKGLTMAQRELRAHEKVAAMAFPADVSPDTRKNRLRELLRLVQPPVADHIDTLWDLSKRVFEQRRTLHDNGPNKHLPFNGRHRHVFLDEICLGALEHPRGAEGYIAQVRASL